MLTKHTSVFRRPPCIRCTSRGPYVFALTQDGKRVYTLTKSSPTGTMTRSAHPARFSPDDKFSRQRITIKKRFGLLPTQQRA